MFKLKGGGEDNKKAENVERKILGTNLIFKRNWLSLVVSLVWLGQVISPSQASVFDIRGGCRVEISLSSLTTFILCGSSPSRFTNSALSSRLSAPAPKRRSRVNGFILPLLRTRLFFPFNPFSFPSPPIVRGR